MIRGYLSVGDVRLAYQDWGGGGRPCLLLHGVMGRASTWTETALALGAAGFRPVGLDMRGHGRSDQPPAGYDRETLVADVAGCMERLGLRDAVVIGHSVGALNGWCLAAQRPDLVGALVAAEMPPELPPALADPVVAWVRSLPQPFPTVRAAHDTFLRMFAARPGTAAYFLESLYESDAGYRILFSPEAVAACFAGASERPWWREWQAVRCPALVVRGEAGAVPPALAEEMAAALPAGDAVTIPEAGHCLHWDNPEDWRAALLRFLRDLPHPG